MGVLRVLWIMFGLSVIMSLCSLTIWAVIAVIDMIGEAIVLHWDKVTLVIGSVIGAVVWAILIASAVREILHKHRRYEVYHDGHGPVIDLGPERVRRHED